MGKRRDVLNLPPTGPVVVVLLAVCTMLFAVVTALYLVRRRFKTSAQRSA
jgi:hypothetical protein